MDKLLAWNIRGLKQALKVLNKDGFGVVDISLIKAKKDLVIAQNVMHNHPDDIMVIDREKQAQDALTIVKLNKNSLLLQKPKLSWLECGDENSKLFYHAIKARRYQNKIHSITDSSGV